MRLDPALLHRLADVSPNALDETLLAACALELADSGCFRTGRKLIEFLSFVVRRHDWSNLVACLHRRCVRSSAALHERPFKPHHCGRVGAIRTHWHYIG